MNPWRDAFLSPPLILLVGKKILLLYYSLCQAFLKLFASGARLFSKTHPAAFLIEVEEYENISKFYVSALKRNASAIILLLMQRRAGKRFERNLVITSIIENERTLSGSYMRSIIGTDMVDGWRATATGRPFQVAHAIEHSRCLHPRECSTAGIVLTPRTTRSVVGRLSVCQIIAREIRFRNGHIAATVFY